MTRYAMVADLNRCVGCQTCTAACKHTNATFPEIQWRKVLDIEYGDFPDVERLFMPVGCQHCYDPPCMHVCPSTATGQRDDGIVTIDYDICIGCSYCAVACPYQARYKQDKPMFSYGESPSITEELRYDEGTIGVAQKCTFCSDRVDEGLEQGLTPGVDPDATPACVNSCIANALHFGDIEDEESNVSQLVAENANFKMHDELETDTGFYYLWDRKDKEIKLPENNTFGNELQKSWDWRAACNFMFGGTGSSLVFLSALASYPENPPLGLGLLSLAIVGLGLLAVWLEIGRPWRFLNVFLHPQTSWMTREANVGVILFILTLVGVGLELPEIYLLAGITGLAYLYCQGRILKASKGIPTWRTPMIMRLIMSTGLCEGMGMLVMILSLLTGATSFIETGFTDLLLVLIVARSWFWYRYRNELADNNAPIASLNRLAAIHWIYLGAGNILPAVLMLSSLSMTNMTMTMMLHFTAGLLVVLSGWYIKYNIVTRASHVQGYALAQPTLN